MVWGGNCLFFYFSFVLYFSSLGISWEGLVPRDGPIFYCDLKEEFLRQGGELGPRGGYTGN